MTVNKVYDISAPVDDGHEFHAKVDISMGEVTFMDICLTPEEFMGYLAQAEQVKQVLIQEGMVHG